MSDFVNIRYWQQPSPKDIPDNLLDFLEQLAGPTIIHIQGRDSRRSRIVTTLLHGNELSGTVAIHQLLREQLQPAVDMYFLIASVETTLLAPRHTHRQLPGQRDLNRCFTTQYHDPIGQLATNILTEIKQISPECVVDMHNTSGTGPSFSVCTASGDIYETITGLFTDTMIVTDLKLGALIEKTTTRCPVVTIECGGCQDTYADDCAYDGLRKLCLTKDLQACQSAHVKVLHNPMRVELEAEAQITYAGEKAHNLDLTLLPNIEKLNSTTTLHKTHFGWVGERGLGVFLLNPSRQSQGLDEIFIIEDDKLYIRENLHCFMLTTVADIAKSDCLGYVFNMS